MAVSKDAFMITYVVENEGADETDRSWWIDTIVSHKEFLFILFSVDLSIKYYNSLRKVSS